MNTTVSTGIREAAARGPARGPAAGQPRSRAATTAPGRRGLPVRPGDPGRGHRAARPARPAARPAGGARPASRPPGSNAAAPRRPASRTPFILLVLTLLGGGLVCLLVINTTLAAASFRISNLQRENAQAAQRAQELQQQVSADQSANAIEQRAFRLGLREQPTLDFINLRTGRRYTMPARARGGYAVPGYTP